MAARFAFRARLDLRFSENGFSQALRVSSVTLQNSVFQVTDRHIGGADNICTAQKCSRYHWVYVYTLVSLGVTVGCVAVPLQNTAVCAGDTEICNLCILCILQTRCRTASIK